MTGLRKKCFDNRISFARLERECGLSNGLLRRWDLDMSHATVSRLKRVADYFGCTIDELIREVD